MSNTKNADALKTYTEVWDTLMGRIVRKRPNPVKGSHRLHLINGRTGEVAAEYVVWTLMHPRTNERRAYTVDAKNDKVWRSDGLRTYDWIRVPDARREWKLYTQELGFRLADAY